MLNTKSGLAARSCSGKRLVGLEANHLAHRGERRGDGVDRPGLVPLGVEIGLLQVVAQDTLRRGTAATFWL